MAIAYTRTLLTPVEGENVASTGTYTSAEQDIGADALASQIWLYVSVAGWEATPAGNEQIIVYLGPVHTTTGSTFGDQPQQWAFEATVDQEYLWPVSIESLPRFFQLSVTNDTAQNIAGVGEEGGLEVWIEYNKVTA